MEQGEVHRLRPHVEINTGSSFIELLDQHKTTSRLLIEPQEEQEEKPISVLSESDDCDFGNAKVDSSAIGNVVRNDAQSSAVFWWPPFAPLFWELWTILLPGCFLALGACAAGLKDAPESIWSIRVIQATKIAPSIWPVVFSGIIGNAIRALADWRVERGVSLLALEQLLASLTMAGSIVTIFRWSILRISSAALVCLWMFNPLGSQASFRGISLQQRTGNLLRPAIYVDPSLDNQMRVTAFDETGLRRMRPTIHALYSTSMYDVFSTIQYVDPGHEVTRGIVSVLGGERYTGMQAASDRWGNVRIPNLKYLDDFSSDDPHKWLETSWDRGVLNYSSLLGDRVDGLDRNITGNTTFTIRSSYQDFMCSQWLNLNLTPPEPAGTNVTNSEADKWLERYTGYNLQHYQSAEGSSITRSSQRTFGVDLVLQNMTTLPEMPELLFASQRSPVELSVTNCSARTTYVDANVSCISNGTINKATCGVSALREASDPPTDPKQSLLDYRNTTLIGFNFFMDLLDDNWNGSESSSDTEFYLYDPLTAFTLLSGSPRGYANLSDLDIGTFERRFSLLWNTLWKASWMKQDAMGGVMGAAYGGEWLSTTTANVTFVLPPTYEINKMWLVIYFISVFIMFFAAVFAMVMRYLCRAPAILGYASSLVRDSPYFEERGVCGNSAEDGIHKSRRLGDVQVMVANVNASEKGAGKIAFAPVGLGQRVKRGKWYI